MANPFVHVELNTTDVEKAKEFYSKLFDWTLEDVEMGPSDTYTIIKVGEGTGGGMLKNPMPGVPSFWLAYVLVDEIGAATKKASEGLGRGSEDGLVQHHSGSDWRRARTVAGKRGDVSAKTFSQKLSIRRTLIRLTSERQKKQKGEDEMRFMVIVKADKDSEAG